MDVASAGTRGTRFEGRTRGAGPLDRCELPTLREGREEVQQVARRWWLCVCSTVRGFRIDLGVYFIEKGHRYKCVLWMDSVAERWISG